MCSFVKNNEKGQEKEEIKRSLSCPGAGKECNSCLSTASFMLWRRSTCCTPYDKQKRCLNAGLAERLIGGSRVGGATFMLTGTKSRSGGSCQHRRRHSFIPTTLAAAEPSGLPPHLLQLGSWILPSSVTTVS